MTTKKELETRINEAKDKLEYGIKYLWDMDEEMQGELNWVIAILKGEKLK